MDQVILNLDKREITGKAVKQLRAKGLVPAVIHDHGKDSVHVVGDYVPMMKAYQVAGKHHPLTVKANGKSYTALIKAADFDPQKHLLRHLVFNAVKADEKVTAEIPVKVRYEAENEASPAERAGLVVLHQLETVEVDARPGDLPNAIYFNGEKLVEAGDHATVADLEVPAGVEIKEDPAQPVATVFEPSALQAANDAAGGTGEEPTAEAEESAEATAPVAKTEEK
ncbi:MAG TPA: 50S ribosomal protein L25 [Patescibacteria group bacterium]|nr:50S ribosomal protein L25 [Patescibacteria group bacterium]